MTLLEHAGLLPDRLVECLEVGASWTRCESLFADVLSRLSHVFPALFVGLRQRLEGTDIDVEVKRPDSAEQRHFESDCVHGTPCRLGHWMVPG